MERRRRVVGEGGSRGVEENTLAILDTSGFSNSRISHHLDVDRLAFLEAVRTTSLLPDNGPAPTPKMFEAILHIMKDADSLDLIIESYHLLIELDKRFPRVLLSREEKPVSSSPSKVLSQLVLVEEAWIPFNFGLDNCNDKGQTTNLSKSPLDSLGFHALIQEVAKVTKELNPEAVETTFLKNILLLQYLISVLQGDFLPRNCAFLGFRANAVAENMNWILLRESILSMLLGSRKIMYKGLIKDCLSTMCGLSQWNVPEETNRAMAFVLREEVKSTCTALKKLFVLIMELDSSRQIADSVGLTTRADGVRTPVVEIILDELIYGSDSLCSFLQVFDPKWKLQILVRYFQKYLPKYSVQTRRSNDMMNTDNLGGILKCLSNRHGTKSIIKKISPDIVQLLLAYAFQAYMALSREHSSEGLSDTSEDFNSNSVIEVCKNMISALTCLRQEDLGAQISSFAKEALFTASIVLSTKPQ